MSNIKDDFFYKYVTEISQYDVDILLEQIFYIKCVEEFCENNNINLLIFHSRNEFVNGQVEVCYINLLTKILREFFWNQWKMLMQV